MKKLLSLFFLFFSLNAISQTSVFDDDWYNKLDSELEYISFTNQNTQEISVRVYRGGYSEHTIRISNQVGRIIYNDKFGKECDIKTSLFECGFYFISVFNDKKMVTQVLFIKP
jgi:hypothetical protein